jgi:hypothetical protein
LASSNANTIEIFFLFQLGVLFLMKWPSREVVMFQNVIMNLKISKEKQISLFFSMSFGIFVFFFFFNEFFLSFQFHTHVYM